MGLNELAKKVHENAVAHGWWEPEFDPEATSDIYLKLKDLYVNKELRDKLFDHMNKTRSFGDIISLCHAELSEALEEHRNHKSPKEIYYRCECEKGKCEKSDSEWKCDMSDDGATYKIKPKPEGIPVELADVIIRILDYCGHEKIDIEQAVSIKMQYNELRPYRHGGKKL